jgi:hypothetical protein
MRFARWVYLAAGIYGILALAPMFLMEGRLAPANPYPVFFYGFAGVAFAWQGLFVVLSTDPSRYRPVMPFCILEKVSFALAAPLLYLVGRATASWLAAAAMDGVFAVLFAAAYVMTGRETTGAGEEGDRSWRSGS